MTDPAVLEEIKARWEQVRHSDRAAVDIGITLLKSALLVNAGSLVALLALSGQLWKEAHETAAKVLTNSHAFMWGLGLAVAGSVVAYVYQSLVTRLELDNLTKLMGRGNGPWKRLRLTTKIFAIMMVSLVLASYVMFLFGTFRIGSALNGCAGGVSGELPTSS
jgi:hypothetical protein